MADYWRNVLLLFCLAFPWRKTSVLAQMMIPQDADRITALPGQPPVSFVQYSGYVTVNKTEGRALFYWLTEAPTSPEKKPLVLWLNGGPGCSSVGIGASEEIGPFRINKDASSLSLNPYAWNKAANILFLESPAGVGFSYTNTSSNLEDAGDKRTAEDNLNFLIEWMLKFPQYQNRDLYICGESYAGHYIPQLAKKIVDYNKSPNSNINLKGIMVGNGVIHTLYDNMGVVAYLWSHSIISDSTYKKIMTSCFSDEGSASECNDIAEYAFDYEVGDIDQYNIYSDEICMEDFQSFRDAEFRSRRFKDTLLRRRPMGFDPCSGYYAEVYYNRPDVQKALHANVTGISYNWTACSDPLFTNWTDSQYSMIPTYKELIASGLRIWIFSGDTDSVVPVTSTRFSLNHFNLTTKIKWYPWSSSKYQIGGWTEVYEEITFATVRGSGHEVPRYKSYQAFLLFRSFLAGRELPKQKQS